MKEPRLPEHQDPPALRAKPKAMKNQHASRDRGLGRSTPARSRALRIPASAIGIVALLFRIRGIPLSRVVPGIAESSFPRCLIPSIKQHFLRLLAACAAFLLGLPSAMAQIKVACVGDSITAGLGIADPGTQSYPAQLQALLGSGYTVQNYGDSGRTLMKNTGYS